MKAHHACNHGHVITNEQYHMLGPLQHAWSAGLMAHERAHARRHTNIYYQHILCADTLDHARRRGPGEGSLLLEIAPLRTCVFVRIRFLERRD